MIMSNEITKAEPALAFSTFTMDNKINKIRVINALNNSSSLNEQPDDMVFECVGVIVENGIRKGRSGNDDKPCENTYIVCKDGTSYFSQSEGIARSIKPIAELFFNSDGTVDADFEGGFIPMRVKTQALTNGNSIKNIEIVFD